MNSTKNQPLVSIIMNCYNGDKYLKEAIDSILAQTYPFWEIIFYDNQSIDQSEAIFNSYSDVRFKYFRSHKHMKLYEARNFALEKASGDFISFLDVDDLWLPQKLELQLASFDNPTIGMSCGNFYFLNEREKDHPITIVHKILPQGKVIEALLSKYFVHMSSLMIKREALNSLEYCFNPSYTIVGDLDILLRLNRNWNLASIQEPITYYRYHGENAGLTLGFLYSEELDSLLLDLGGQKDITALPKFKYFSQRVHWYRVIRFLSEGNKKGVLEIIKSLNNLNKIKALVALCLPFWILNRRIKRKSKIA